MNDLCGKISAELMTRPTSKTKDDEIHFQCIAHPDQHKNGDAHPSASWNEKKGAWNCHVCGAKGGYIAMAKLLGIEAKDKSLISPSVKGVTLLHLCEAKRIDADFLRSLGVTDSRNAKYGQPEVLMEYRDPAGVVIGVRRRVSLDGDLRFLWRKGDKVNLYGLWRLQQMRKHGWVLIVEGESDCWTGWTYDIPVLGAPGKETWKPAWAKHLDGLDVFLWQEPKAEDFTNRVAKDIPNLRVIIAPDGTKDISDAHIQGKDVWHLLEELKAKAPRVHLLQMAQKDNHAAEIEALAQPVIQAADPIVLVESAIRSMGYGGDLKPAKTTYLALTSRLLTMRPGTMPVHLLLLGPPSAGKSYTLQTALRLLPPEAYHAIDAGSPRVLIYDGADLQHRAVLFGEADSLPSGEDNPAASAIRNLLQDGSLHYKTTVRDPESGSLAVLDINKPGPSVLITTAVRRLGPQLDSRLFSLEVSDDPAQIRQSLRVQADIEVNGATVASDAMIAYQSYLQAQAPWDVVVPFARDLAEKIGKTTAIPRINRDFARLLSLIKAVAVMRHPRRQRDSAGRLVAQIEDYATVYELTAQMYETTVTGASERVRRVVRAVAELCKRQDVTPTVTVIANEIGLGKMAVSRATRTAVKYGWLINDEFKKGHPANFKIGDPMPEEAGLPRPEELGCNTVTPLTAGNGRDNSQAVTTPAEPVAVAATRAPFDEGPGGDWQEGF